MFFSTLEEVFYNYSLTYQCYVIGIANNNINKAVLLTVLFSLL